MGSISLTIPQEAGPLRRAANMLTELAEDCETIKAPEVSTPVEVPGGIIGVDIVSGSGAAVLEVTEEPLDISLQRETAVALDTVELDSEGLPWDARIHGGGKKKLAKTQAWTLIRGVDKTLVETVKAELRALVAPVVLGAASETAGIAAVPEVPEVPVVTETPVATEVPVVTETPAAVEIPVTFETICAKVTERANAQLLQPTDMTAVLAPHGLTDLAGLAQRPDLFVQVSTALDTLWATTPA